MRGGGVIKAENGGVGGEVGTQGGQQFSICKRVVKVVSCNIQGTAWGCSPKPRFWAW